MPSDILASNRVGTLPEIKSSLITNGASRSKKGVRFQSTDNAYASASPGHKSMTHQYANAPGQEPLSNLLEFDVGEMSKQFDLDNRRFSQVNQEKLRARERAMLAELQSLHSKKSRIKALKVKQNTVAERLRLEVRKHAEKQRIANLEALEIEKTLKEIDRSKRVALEQFKQEEMKRLAQERDEAAKERKEIEK